MNPFDQNPEKQSPDEVDSSEQISSTPEELGEQPEEAATEPATSGDAESAADLEASLSSEADAEAADGFAESLAQEAATGRTPDVDPDAPAADTLAETGETPDDAEVAEGIPAPSVEAEIAAEEDLREEGSAEGGPPPEGAEELRAVEELEKTEELLEAQPDSDAPDPNLIPGQDENPNMNWFIIHTYSGFENKVSESLRTRADAFGFAHRLGQVLIPTEEVVEMRNGKKVTSKRLLYPGYVLVQMEMDDDLWHQVKATPRVTGFVGGGGQPVPLTATEVNSILYRQTEAAERPRPKLTFEKNETVRIIDGPFANFSGKVDEINMERNTLRVMVTIFGRSTPVELDFLQVEKIA